jgi:hypothetical protein
MKYKGTDYIAFLPGNCPYFQQRDKIEGTTGVIRRTYNTINGQNKRGDDVPLAPSYVKSFVSWFVLHVFVMIQNK